MVRKMGSGWKRDKRGRKEKREKREANKQVDGEQEKERERNNGHLLNAAVRPASRCRSNTPCSSTRASSSRQRW